LPRRRLRRRFTIGGVEDGEERPDRDGLALLHLYFFERSRDRRGDLGVHLVGLHLDEQVVFVDLLTGLLQPLADRPLGD
jgi:hypothetical protein